MPGANGFRVTASGLRAHASSVGSIGDGFQQAQDAANTVVLGGAAFGILCQVLPLMFGDLQSVVAEHIGSAGTHLKEMAENLIDSAVDYAGTESTNTNAFNGIAVSR